MLFYSVNSTFFNIFVIQKKTGTRNHARTICEQKSSGAGTFSYAFVYYAITSLQLVLCLEWRDMSSGLLCAKINDCFDRGITSSDREQV